MEPGMQFVVVNYTPDQAGLDILPCDVIRVLTDDGTLQRRLHYSVGRAAPVAPLMGRAQVATARDRLVCFAKTAVHM